MPIRALRAGPSQLALSQMGLGTVGGSWFRLLTPGSELATPQDFSYPQMHKMGAGEVKGQIKPATPIGRR